MKTSKNILIATGGTGGHVFPACSLAEYFLEKNLNVKILIDRRGIKYIKNYLNIDYEIITSATLFKKNPINIVVSFIKITFAFLKSIHILRKFKPKIVFGMGGYSSFPICIAAKILKIPFIIYENNLYVGRANKILLPFSEKIFVSYSSVEGIKNKYKHKIYEIGNLIRKDILQYKNLNKNRNNSALTILVLGGSQGANVFALKLPDIFEQCIKSNIKLNIYQQCLPFQNHQLKKKYDSLDIENEIFNFSNNLLGIFPKIDLVISRSGASMLGELLNCCIPLVSIPLPTSADNHQLKNAKYFEKMGYGFLVEQQQISESLFPLIKSIHKDKDLLDQMIQKQKKHSDKDIFKKIENQIKKIIND